MLNFFVFGFGRIQISIDIRKRREKNNVLKKNIAQKLNLSRNLTAYDEEYILNWTENYKYDMDIIEIALKKAATKNS